MKKTCILIFLLITSSLILFSQEFKRIRVEPPFWWAGFKNSELQLLVYSENIGKTNAAIFTPGVELKRMHVMENPNYVFLDIIVSENAESGSFPITFYEDGKKVAEYLYELKGREEGSSSRKSFKARIFHGHFQPFGSVTSVDCQSADWKNYQKFIR